MEYRNRFIEQLCLELLNHFPVLAVFGARQSGKSTLVQHLGIDDLTTVVFDPVQDIGGARSDPDFFLQNQSFPLFLDEVQFAPELLASVKRQVDREKETGRFILSGSQNLSALRSVSESLAGRVAVVNLFPMATKEIGERTADGQVLEKIVVGGQRDLLSHKCGPPQPALKAIWKGGFPGLLDMPEHLYHRYFESYLQTYIERDVRTAAQIGSLQTFGAFMGLLAALTACEINHNQLGRELSVDRKTAKAWTEIAMATYQWHQVPSYSRNAIKRLAGKPKGFFTDTGFACFLHHIANARALAGHPMRGQMFETMVFLEILKQVQAWPTRPGIYHYRAYSGAEVDLVLELNGILYPIEIKMKTHPSARDLGGIRSFKNCFPNAEIGPGLVVCSCESIQRITEDVYAVPWWEI